MSTVETDANLKRRVVIEGVGIAVGGSLILLGAIVEDWFSISVGAGLLVLALLDVLRLRRLGAATGSWLRPASSAVAGAVFVVVDPNVGRTAGILVGSVLIVGGLVWIWKSLRSPDEQWELIVMAMVEFALAALVILFPGAALRAVTASVGIALLVVGGAVVAMALAGRVDEATRPWAAFRSWVRDQQYSPTERQDLVSSLYFVGTDARKRFTRFATLLLLAAVIATLAVVADNVAVVIGAMLISPITAPLMGIAAGILLGYRRRTLWALATLVGAAVVVVALAALIGAMIPSFSLERNNLLSTFATPTLIDLVVALAAGAAGGFATARKDVSNSLPGVAVSLTLVPALAAAGLLFQEGAVSFGFGALLTFVTNAVAIILAASVAFVMTGFAPLRRIEASGQSVRLGLGLVVLSVVLVTIPLAWTVEQIIDRNDLVTGVEVETIEWLGENSTYEVLDVSLLKEAVEVRIAGTGELPAVSGLIARVNEKAGRQIELVVKVIEQRILSPGG